MFLSKEAPRESGTPAIELIFRLLWLNLSSVIDGVLLFWDGWRLLRGDFSLVMHDSFSLS